MKEFISDDDLPPYAILSHTWEEDEVSFQQWETRDTLDISHMQGYKKIRKFGQEAASNGFQWAWADTCCIDKESSAELSEAINSMFRWYRNAHICYTHLTDVFLDASTVTTDGVNDRIRTSRWFTRGWTLQELIAPVQGNFYSADWLPIGTKHDLCDLLSSITGIDHVILRGTAELEDISVARRMSWASRRQTSRVEDTAYSLLGLFDVNIPLIYGEGRKAFQRLQEAIMSSTNDQSLFAWGRIVDTPGEMMKPEQDPRSLPWKEPLDRLPLLGLFANSPADFKQSAGMVPVNTLTVLEHQRRNHPIIAHRGVLISLLVWERLRCVSYLDGCRPPVNQGEIREIALLFCNSDDRSMGYIGLVLHPWGYGYFSRTDELVYMDCVVGFDNLAFKARQRHLLPFKPLVVENFDIHFRQWDVPEQLKWGNSGLMPRDNGWVTMSGGRVLRNTLRAHVDDANSFFYDRFIITLKRVCQQRLLLPEDLGYLMIGITLLDDLKERFKLSLSGYETNTWRPLATLDGKPLDLPFFSHVMEPPWDDWDLELEDLFRLHVEVTRHELNAKRGGIDTVDLVIK